MILMDRIVVPDVPLDVYLFLNLHLHIVFSVQSFERFKLSALSKRLVAGRGPFSFCGK